MTAQDFLDWMEHVGVRKASEIVGLLDVSRNTAQIWVRDAQSGKDLEIKKTVALAMAAVAKDIKPWRHE